jgi:hypothetical protein
MTRRVADFDAMSGSTGAEGAAEVARAVDWLGAAAVLSAFGVDPCVFAHAGGVVAGLAAGQHGSLR